MVAGTVEAGHGPVYAWFLKYFCEGQTTASTLKAAGTEYGHAGDASLRTPDDDGGDKTFAGRYRKMIALFLPVAVVHACWWAYMVREDAWDDFTGPSGANGVPRWYMSVTMVFGSIVAGATSEGGASIAFPVMTLVFGMNPIVARDFSFMIQSVGMTSAAFTILYMRVLVEWKAIVYTTLGGVAGIIFGLEYCLLDPPYAKMYFVCIWGAFAASLYFLNRDPHRKVYLVLDPPHLPAIWKVNI